MRSFGFGRSLFVHAPFCVVCVVVSVNRQGVERPGFFVRSWRVSGLDVDGSTVYWLLRGHNKFCRGSVTSAPLKPQRSDHSSYR